MFLKYLGDLVGIYVWMLICLDHKSQIMQECVSFSVLVHFDVNNSASAYEGVCVYIQCISSDRLRHFTSQSS